MAFVRMILPAWLAGLYASLLLMLLILFLNPDLPASLSSLAGLLPLGLLLSVPAALGWPLGYRFVRVFARRPLRIRGVPFKYLYGFATADLLLVSAIYWYNATLTEVMVPPIVSSRLHLASAAVTGAALAFLAGVAVPWFRRHAGARACFHLLAALLPACLLLVRPGYHPAPAPHYTAEPVRPSPLAPRTLVLGIEGATLDQILPMVAQGKLPWFARLLQRGAHGRLSPFRPCLSPAVWQSLWTGSLPFKHQILDSARYLLPVGSGEVRLVPRGMGFRHLAGICGLVRRRQDPGESQSLTFSEILTRLEHPVREFDSEGALPPASPDSRLPDIRLDRFLDPEVPVPPETESLPVSLLKALEDDQGAAAAGFAAWRGGEAKTVILELRGLDRVSHLFLRYGMPAGFGDVPPEEEEKYGNVMARYYRFLDEWLGKFLEGEGIAGEGGDSFGERTAFFVVSPHGIEPIPLGRRLLGWLEGRRFDSGYHVKGPDGMILAAGPGIRHGTPLGKASVTDLLPTLLYYYRLPIGQDMDGHALTRLFDPDFTLENPILLIPSYETRQDGAGTEAPR